MKCSMLLKSCGVMVLSLAAASWSQARSFEGPCTGSSATDARWVQMTSANNRKISIRFYCEGDSHYAELERGDKTYGLSKAMEDARGNWVYGDGETLTAATDRRGTRLDITMGSITERYTVAAPRRAETQAQAKRRYNRDEAEMADATTPWMTLRDARGREVAIRYFNQGESAYADLRMGKRVIRLSKATEDPQGNPVYGDGDRLTVISREGGGALEITDGRSRSVYR